MDQTTKPCNVCGNVEFMNRDGFFFCLECGTQAENVLEVAAEDEHIQETQHSARTKVKSAKKNENELTSWELANYILVGLVDELIAVGAKDELKLKTFQLWAEFLRKNEVAFFKPKANSLPKLTASFNPKDAKILYNHHLPKQKRKKSNASSAASSITWRRQKRKFARSEYEKSMSEADLSMTTLLSSSQTSVSSTISRGISLNLKDSARKLMKKTIHTKHLAKHENDYEKKMGCKCVPLKKTNIYYEQRKDELFNRRTLFSLLYIALNLIDDNIQLIDLVRLSRQGNISSRDFGHFFPENIRNLCEKDLSRYDFPKVFDQSGISIRKQAAVICNLLSIRKLNTPDFIGLVARFCKDFVLPQELILFVGRLINFFPPEMEYMTNTTPFYEGRAIAYIIFVLKLLFGLDDVKEKKISESAQNINKILENTGRRERLFVWEDWMKFVEIRKLILARYNICYLEYNKDFKNLNSVLNKQVDESVACKEEYYGPNRINVMNMNQIFHTYLKDSRRVQPYSTLNFITFTPQVDYFEKILYDPPEDIIISEFLKFDHSSTEIKPFLNPQKIKQNLKLEKINLKIFKEKGNENLNFVEPFSYKTRLPKENPISLRNIKYADSLNQKGNDTKKMCESYFKTLNIEFLKPTKEKPTEIKRKYKKKTSKASKIALRENFELRTFKYYSLLHEDVATEENSLFCNLSDSSSSLDKSDSIDARIEETFSISDMKYWILHGKLDITEEDFKNIKRHFPRSFLWLLETFALYLEVDLESLYHELIIIENYYFYKFDDKHRIRNILVENPEKKSVGSQYSDYFSKFW